MNHEKKTNHRFVVGTVLVAFSLTLPLPLLASVEGEAEFIINDGKQDQLTEALQEQVEPSKKRAVQQTPAVDELNQSEPENQKSEKIKHSS
ncbi:hypothetical protein [Photobacterium sp. 1_MG-2023]|uniref:hypothetical protein n=1 Tax=Photobacterium sp. 1_MG-2023 TaxID=3062646 RepID=UPI0026E3700E|nr:hypothetical protein [Photobacterium sp. 1_MG-2023]MDO6705140.1 hypothetical protein [Photobacterium sp. 1_MG-2023]